MPGISITISRLCKSFAGKPILRDVSLCVSPGQTVCLIGPSGGGKSTLLRCVNGLHSFDSGSIRVGDHELKPGAVGACESIRRTAGMVFQDFRLFPHMTALENVMEAPRQLLKTPLKQAQGQAKELLQHVGLEDRAHHRPHELSGGQQQRVAIARALAMKPQALLCDEITSALDPERKHDVLEVLERLQAEGLTILMVTHEIGFARRAADQVVVLAEGEIIETGPPDQVLGAPQTQRTRQFLARVLG